MNEDCPHCVFEKTEVNCRGCFEESHYKPKQITNADRIRSLPDEELAAFFGVEIFKYPECNREFFSMYSDVEECGQPDCTGCWLEWLKKESKGEN